MLLSWIFDFRVVVEIANVKFDFFAILHITQSTMKSFLITKNAYNMICEKKNNVQRLRKQILIHDFISSNHFSFSMFSIIEIINFFSFFFFVFIFFICSIFKTSTLYSLSFYIKWRNYTISRRVKIDYYRTSFSKKILMSNFDEKKKS